MAIAPCPCPSPAGATGDVHGFRFVQAAPGAHDLEIAVAPVDASDTTRLTCKGQVGGRRYEVLRFACPANPARDNRRA